MPRDLAILVLIPFLAALAIGVICGPRFSGWSMIVAGVAAIAILAASVFLQRDDPRWAYDTFMVMCSVATGFFGPMIVKRWKIAAIISMLSLPIVTLAAFYVVVWHACISGRGCL